MQKRLDPLSEPGRIYRHSARELLALSAWKNNDATAAKRYLDMIAADGETPPGTRQRIDVLSAQVGGKAAPAKKAAAKPAAKAPAKRAARKAA